MVLRLADPASWCGGSRRGECSRPRLSLQLFTPLSMTCAWRRLSSMCWTRPATQSATWKRQAQNSLVTEVVDVKGICAIEGEIRRVAELSLKR